MWVKPKTYQWQNHCRCVMCERRGQNRVMLWSVMRTIGEDHWWGPLVRGFAKCATIRVKLWYIYIYMAPWSCGIIFWYRKSASDADSIWVGISVWSAWPSDHRLVNIIALYTKPYLPKWNIHFLKGPGVMKFGNCEPPKAAIPLKQGTPGPRCQTSPKECMKIVKKVRL